MTAKLELQEAIPALQGTKWMNIIMNLQKRSCFPPPPPQKKKEALKSRFVILLTVAQSSYGDLPFAETVLSCPEALLSRNIFF